MAKKKMKKIKTKLSNKLRFKRNQVQKMLTIKNRFKLRWKGQVQLNQANLNEIYNKIYKIYLN